jgi:hypothetical protein
MRTNNARGSVLVAGVVACLLGAGFVVGASVSGAGVTASSGKSFAEALLASAPRPNGAIATGRLSAPLLFPLNGIGTIDVHQDYLWKSTQSLGSFVHSHRPAGALIGGPSTGTSTGSVESTTYEVSLPLANRHVSYESIDYTVGYTSSGVEELRIDAEVDWAPIRTVEMPTSGVVTLTGFARTSDMNPSSEPTSVTLTKSEAQRLRSRIATLSNAFYGSVCMEDSTLFTLSVAPGPGQRATWSASGDICPGDLYVVNGTEHITLVDTPCSLRSLIVSLLPADKAQASRNALKSCGPRL